MTAKYGTAAGPTGLPHTTPFTFDIASIMVLLGLVLFVVILLVLIRDWQTMQTLQKARELS